MKLGSSTFRAEIAERLALYDSSDLRHKPLPPVWSLPVSRPGVVTAIVFGGLTLLPSMLPKNAFIQGVTLGIDFMVGYALGAAAQWAWRFLELPTPRGPRWRMVVRSWYGVLGLLLAISLWRHVGWQNRLRSAFGMDEIAPSVWVLIFPIAVIVAGLILITARSLRKVFNLIIRWFDRHLPRRLALLLGGLAFTVLVWGLWSQVLVDGFFAAANQLSAPVDASTDEGANPPATPLRSGSPASLVAWDTLGRQGRNFVGSGPTVDELNAYSGGGSIEPIRVYVGLKSAATVEERAQLILEELIRTGAFDRKVLVIASTTGTGFVDPRAMEALEFLMNGDVAVAGVQYSYLPSPVSLLADVDEVRATSQAVFDIIHQYWSSLPDDARPEIHLYGLSLGSLGVESILTSIDIINEPIDGALMVGPTFVNDLRNRIIVGRDPGSTAVTPIYEDGRTVRFTNEVSAVSRPDGSWGDTRILYLQHASDPVVFFTPDLLLDRPDWLVGDHRDAEIDDDFRWIPFVTMWQVLTDMAVANGVPEGFGHVYSAQAHVDAWAAIIQPDGWSESDITALKTYVSELDARSSSDG